MKAITAAFALALIFLSASPAAAAEIWRIDPQHTSVGFTVQHLVSFLDGRFKTISGDIRFSPDDLEESSVILRIPSQSLDTGSAERDNLLEGVTFLDAAAYPEIRFESNRLEQTGEGVYLAHGMLRVRDTERALALPVVLLGYMDQDGTKIMGLHSRFTIRPADFGITDPEATSQWGDIMRVSIFMQCVRVGETGLDIDPREPRIQKILQN